MSASTCSCPPESCGALPQAFHRLRYFFGKRLGVTDFIDEQRYHASKHRFANQHLHGAGVLCGLDAALLEVGSTVVRLRKGAALDRCGREIIVGYDQCIDVDAWYRRERDQALDADPTSTFPATWLDAEGKLPLCVVLRYSECPSHPEPAPRDPCSCAEGGSDWGRVSEGFELKLVPASEAERWAEPELFPSRAELDRAVCEAATPSGLVHALAQLVTGDRPAPEAEDWLVLARFRAVLDAGRARVDSVQDLTGTPILLSTAVLQHLLLGLLSRNDGPGPAVGGPEIIAVALESLPLPHPPHCRIRLTLSGPIVSQTLDDDQFRLVRLGPAGWDPPGADAVESSYSQVAEGTYIDIDIDNSAGFLEEGGLYRLTLMDTLDPIVDEHMRQLRPLRFAKDFRLGLVDGELTMLAPPYTQACAAEEP